MLYMYIYMCVCTGVGGYDGDGDITKPDNLVAFQDYVLEQTEGKGVHFVMGDGVRMYRNGMVMCMQQKCIRNGGAKGVQLPTLVTVTPSTKYNNTYCTYFPGFEIARTAEYKLALYISS